MHKHVGFPNSEQLFPEFQMPIIITIMDFPTEQRAKLYTYYIHPDGDDVYIVE